MSTTLKEKTKFQQLANNFEHYCVQVLSDENDKTNWYHWTKAPHEVLFESGYIHSYHQYRKRECYNPIKMEILLEMLVWILSDK